MHLFVKPFSEITAGDVALAGGKGANLGEMYQQSIPVPNGFVVLSACFREFIGLTRLEEELATALKSVNGDDIDAMQSLSDTLTHRILEAPVPGDMSDQTLRYFDHWEHHWWLSVPAPPLKTEQIQLGQDNLIPIWGQHGMTC